MCACAYGCLFLFCSYVSRFIFFILSNFLLVVVVYFFLCLGFALNPPHTTHRPFTFLINCSFLFEFVLGGAFVSDIEASGDNQGKAYSADILFGCFSYSL